MAQPDATRESKKLRREIEKIRNHDSISDKNKEVLLDLRTYMEKEGLEDSTLRRRLEVLRILLTECGEAFYLGEPSEEDLYRIYREVTWSRYQEEKPEEAFEDCDKDFGDYTIGTQRNYLKGVRKLATFLAQSDDYGSIESVDEVITWKMPSKEASLDEKTVPRPKHIEQLLENVNENPIQMKALIMMLWNGGRVSEVLNLRWGQVDFSGAIAEVEYGAEIGTKRGKAKNKKTTREVPLWEATLYMERWREHDPKGDDPNAFVFRSENGEQLTASAVRRRLKRIRKKTDIPQKIRTCPHSHRKGKCRVLALSGFDYSDLCEHFGWHVGSQVPERYLALKEDDLEDKGRKYSEVYDVEDNEEFDGGFYFVVRCHNCGVTCRREQKHCENCSAELTHSKMYELKQIESAKEELKTAVITEEVGYTDEEINEKAKEIVRSKKQAT